MAYLIEKFDFTCICFKFVCTYLQWHINVIRDFLSDDNEKMHLENKFYLYMFILYIFAMAYKCNSWLFIWW